MAVFVRVCCVMWCVDVSALCDVVKGQHSSECALWCGEGPTQ